MSMHQWVDAAGSIMCKRNETREVSPECSNGDGGEGWCEGKGGPQRFF